MYTYPPVKKAYKLLRDISADIPIRDLADIRERALKNEVTLLDEATTKGIVAGKKAEQLNIARALLDILDDKTIAQKTKLTMATIRKLRKET